MLQNKKRVGIIIGRFQEVNLKQNQIYNIQKVIDANDRVIIILGNSSLKFSTNNPFDFHCRKYMINNVFPEIDVFYINDINNDIKWSNDLDNIITHKIKKIDEAVLYGRQVTFIDRYKGKFPTQVLEQETYESSKNPRKDISEVDMSDDRFRKGMLYVIQNSYPKAIPTVDVAIWNKSRDKLLFGRKPNEERFRFIGGYIEPKMTAEENAVKETLEEARIKTTEPQYVCSMPIDDWRYLNEKDGMVTFLYECEHISGIPEPDDDICELKWFKVDELKVDDLVENHQTLLCGLVNKYAYKFSSMLFKEAPKKNKAEK